MPEFFLPPSLAHTLGSVGLLTPCYHCSFFFLSPTSLHFSAASAATAAVAAAAKSLQLSLSLSPSRLPPPLLCPLS